ncbi:hypothetical protein ECKG_05047 [Escherichia coli TA206]|nr:hypothetical protein ECKG_05047 [Escherichia coli TA206]
MRFLRQKAIEGVLQGTYNWSYGKSEVFMAYDENSIRVMSADEIEQRFGWLRLENLAKEHHLPVDWVRRGFEACWRLGIEPDYFIDRYIFKRDVPQVPEFEVVFREIVNENRYRDRMRF